MSAPDRNLALELVRVTESAALAASRWVGRGDKIGADGAAVDAMRTVLSSFFSTYEPLWPHLSGLLQHTADDNANSNDKK